MFFFYKYYKQSWLVFRSKDYLPYKVCNLYIILYNSGLDRVLFWSATALLNLTQYNDGLHISSYLSTYFFLSVNILSLWTNYIGFACVVEFWNCVLWITKICWNINTVKEHSTSENLYNKCFVLKKSFIHNTNMLETWHNPLSTHWVRKRLSNKILWFNICNNIVWLLFLRVF